MHTSQIALCQQLTSGQSLVLPACPAPSSVQADSTISTDPVFIPQLVSCPVWQLDLH